VVPREVGITNSFKNSCRFVTNTMMLPTHALVGMIIALPVALSAPELSAVALAAGLLGGVFPDLDMYVGHRKTLHFPVYYSVLAAITTGLALFAGTPIAIAAALFLLGAAAHCVADVYGGGLELHPWEATSERAVYDHYRGRWIAPRRLIGYDGSPADLGLAIGAAVPLLVAVEGPFRLIVFGAVTVGVVYTTLRRILPTLAIRLAAILPSSAMAYLPRRYREATPERNYSSD
jgi:hypothetical protein